MHVARDSVDIMHGHVYLSKGPALDENRIFQDLTIGWSNNPYFINQNPSWEANQFSDSQEIPTVF
jgi:hypothetical protein